MEDPICYGLQPCASVLLVDTSDILSRYGFWTIGGIAVSVMVGGIGLEVELTSRVIIRIAW